MTTRNPSAADQAQTPPDPGVATAPVVHDENPAVPDAARMDPEESTSYLKAIEENYAQYRATAPIPWGNALAFNPGDAVPADYPRLAELLDGGFVEKTPAAAGSRKSRR